MNRIATIVVPQSGAPGRPREGGPDTRRSGSCDATGQAEEPRPSFRSIRVAIADGRPLARLALAALISQFNDVVLIGHVDTVELAAEIIEQFSLDALIIASDLVASSTAYELARLRSKERLTRIVALVDHGSALAESRAPYCDALIEWGSPPQCLLTALRPAEGGGARSRSNSSSLTARQLEVMVLVEQGLTNMQIARALGISLGTVKRHLEASFSSLSAHSRVEAIMRALSLGLLTEQPIPAQDTYPPDRLKMIGDD